MQVNTIAQVQPIAPKNGAYTGHKSDIFFSCSVVLADRKTKDAGLLVERFETDNTARSTNRATPGGDRICGLPTLCRVWQGGLSLIRITFAVGLEVIYRHEG